MHVDRSRFLLLTATLAAAGCNAKTDGKADDKTEAKADDKAEAKPDDKADDKATPSSPDTVTPPGSGGGTGPSAAPIPERAVPSPVDESGAPASVTEG